jgi:hypothetical protein
VPNLNIYSVPKVWLPRSWSLRVCSIVGIYAGHVHSHVVCRPQPAEILRRIFKVFRSQKAPNHTRSLQGHVGVRELYAPRIHSESQGTWVEQQRREQVHQKYSLSTRRFFNVQTHGGILVGTRSLDNESQYLNLINRGSHSTHSHLPSETHGAFEHIE